LRLSEKNARAIIEASPVPLAIHDDDGKITYLNRAFLNSIGYTLRDIPALDDCWRRACPDPQYRQYVKDQWVARQQQAKRLGQPFAPLEVNFLCKDDAKRTFVCSATAIEDVVAGSQLIILHDITDQVRAAEKINTLMREQKAILDTELVGIVTVTDRRIVWANPAFEKLFGYARGELIGTSARVTYCSKEAYEAFGQNAYPVIRSGHSYRTEHEYQRKDGSRFFADVSGSMLVPGTGDSLWCFIDVTDRKRNEQEIAHLAFYDVLTALPNRRLLLDRLSQAMAANKRTDRHSAVIFLDLDNFKSLNDTHGHGVGDLLLLEVAERLKRCVREMDTVSRFGGDEFVVLLGELASGKADSTAQAQVIAEKIRATLAEPYVLTPEAHGSATRSVEHRCSASIGVVVFDGDKVDQDEILRLADVAMYQAKDGGRNAIQFYEG
jgi:diguanylate cyclase (GGDEF)-like protein/PAS domain S-box-containing protein